MDFSKLSVLVIEDAEDIAALVERCLSEMAMNVTIVGSNKAARLAIADKAYDLAILDLGLPDGDGLSLARDIAAMKNTGLIILTGRAEVADKVIGLELGADDYITKPFERREFNARVKALARRIFTLQPTPESNGQAEGTVRFDNWTIHFDKMRIDNTDGTSHDLISSEFNLLKIFLERPGRVLSRDQLMDYLFETATPAFDRSIDVRISRLRAKIEEDPKHPTLIVTARNVGYVFRGKVMR
ncbi:MAG: response regulator transcription factor [Rhodospirillales bacterium]